MRAADERMRTGDWCPSRAAIGQIEAAIKLIESAYGPDRVAIEWGDVHRTSQPIRRG